MNGQEVTGLSRAEVVGLLREPRLEVTLVVSRQEVVEEGEAEEVSIRTHTVKLSPFTLSFLPSVTLVNSLLSHYPLVHNSGQDSTDAGHSLVQHRVCWSRGHSLWTDNPWLSWRYGYLHQEYCTGWSSRTGETTPTLYIHFLSLRR